MTEKEREALFAKYFGTMVKSVSAITSTYTLQFSIS